MAEVVEKIIEVKTKVEKAENIKELKAEIEQLTEQMNSLEAGTEEYNETVNKLVEAQEELTTAMKVGKSQLSAQEGSYNALVNEMAALKKVMHSVTDASKRMELSKRINDINNELKEMDAQQGVFVRNVGNYENAIKSALQTPQQELKKLRQELANLEEGTAEYNATFARMAQLTHDVTEQQELLKWSSSDLGDMLGNVAGVATSLAGGLSAMNALQGLFGGDGGELEKAMLQAQRFIQLIQGLEQLEQLGDKLKGLWKGIENFNQDTAASEIALANFTEEAERAGEASEKTAGALASNVAATTQSAQASNNNAEALEKEAQAYDVLADAMVEALVGNAEYVEQLEAKLESLQTELSETRDRLAELRAEKMACNEADTDLIEANEFLTKVFEQDEEALVDEIQALKEKIATTKSHTRTIEDNADAEIKSIRKRTEVLNVENKTVEISHKGWKKWLAIQILNSKQNKLSIAEINAMTGAQLVNTAATLAWAAAWKVLRAAIISTGIGIILVAIGSLINLLIEGAKALFGFGDKAEDAAEKVEKLESVIDELNTSLEAQERVWSRTEKYLKAVGASYERIYNARRANLVKQKEMVEAQLREQELIEASIPLIDLLSDEYADFRDKMAELRNEWGRLNEAINDLDYDKELHEIEEQRKAEEEAAEARRRAADAAISAYNAQKEEANKLYKSLQDHYKTEQQKLKEKYEQEKKLLEKFGKDTTLLTKKYEEDKTAITLKELEARRKAAEEYNRLANSLLSGEALLEEQLEEAEMAAEIWNEYADNFDEFGASLPSGVIEKFNQEFGLTMDSLDDFKLHMDLANKAVEDAKKALEDYRKEQAKIASDKIVASIEKEINAINRLMEVKSRQKDQEYGLYESTNNIYTDFSNNYISQMYKRWQTEDEIHKLRIEAMQQVAQKYKEASENMSLTDEARLDALANYAAMEQEIELANTDYVIASNQRKAEATDNYVAAIQDSLDGIGQILQSVADAWETSIQAQIDAGEISEEEGERQMENMRGIQSAIAMINALSSAVSAYNSLASIPYVGPALGAAAAAAALASGIAQVVAINKVKKGDKGGESNRYAEVVPTMPEYNPQIVQNATSYQEKEDLANAMSNTPIWVSVKDIDSVQSRVKTKENETTF